MDEVQVYIIILQLIIQAIEYPETTLVGRTYQLSLVYSQIIKPDGTAYFRKEVVYPDDLVMVPVIDQEPEWVRYINGRYIPEKRVRILGSTGIITDILEQLIFPDDVYVPDGIREMPVSFYLHGFDKMKFNRQKQ
jgi:hypothetical protein